MQELISEVVGEVLSVVLLSIGSGVLTAAGLLGERAALANLLSGHLALGAWCLLMGGTAIFAGVYLLGYLQLWPRLQGLAG